MPLLVIPAKTGLRLQIANANVEGGPKGERGGWRESSSALPSSARASTEMMRF